MSRLKDVLSALKMVSNGWIIVTVPDKFSSLLMTVISAFRSL